MIAVLTCDYTIVPLAVVPLVRLGRLGCFVRLLFVIALIRPGALQV